MEERKVRIYLQSSLAGPPSLLDGVTCREVDVMHGAQVEVVGVNTRRRLLAHLWGPVVHKRLIEVAGDTPSDLILNFENIVKVTVETLAPNLLTGFSVGQLRGDANTTACLADAPLQDITDIQIVPDVGHADGSVLVSKHGG